MRYLVGFRTVSHGDRRGCYGRAAAIASAEFDQHLVEFALKGGAGVREHDAVLRTLGAGDARDDVAEIKYERVGVDRLGRVRLAEHALRLRVGLHERNLLRRPARELHVLERFAVDGEDAASRAVLGRHVGERRAIGQRQIVQPRPVELDEFAHHALFSQHLYDHENQVGRRGAFFQIACEPEAHHVGNQHRVGLAQHGGFGLDAAHAPAQDADAVDHRGVRIRAHDGIGKGARDASFFVRAHHRGEKLEVHLVDDTGVGRHGPEVVEGVLRPAQKGVTLGVPVVFELRVVLERRLGAELIHLHGVVDHQIDGLQRIDEVGVAAQILHGVAHDGQVDHDGNTREVLQQNAARHEADLFRLVVLRVPGGERLDVCGAHGAPVLVSKQILQQDLHGVGEPLDVALVLQGVDPVDLIGFPAYFEL